MTACCTALLAVLPGTIVHEWGTFTSIAGQSGQALEWSPLEGPTELPRFVHNCLGASSSPKRNWRARIRMETPVLYFYTDRDTTLSVQVDFPKGTITEWYPQARWTGARIAWDQVEVSPFSNADFPAESGENHYYAARQTDAAPLRVAGQSEKFLFYRGLGNFDPPLAARLAQDRVVLTDLGGVGVAILFENRSGKVGYTVQDPLGDTVTLDHPALTRTTASLETELQRILTAQGLYEKEARAMIRTWRCSWFQEGARVFYIVPRPFTDAVLPITIEPPPDELVRVLVGRIELRR
jgi:hypothetical protein